MRTQLRPIINYISNNWERIIFALFGFLGLYFCIGFLIERKTNEAAIVFVLAFFSFFYSNLARFRRFKGLGFEAELWEDKQKEAEHLIGRLKRVVAIYTSEVVMGSVKRGRLDADSWKKHWDLFSELIEQHSDLGQDIDFSDLKDELDTYFLFDMCGELSPSIWQEIDRGKREAQTKISKEFGDPVNDLEAYNKQIGKLRDIKSNVENSFYIARKENLAERILETANESKDKLSQYFGIDINFDEEKISRLKRIAGLFNTRPVKVTDELVSWAD